MDDDFDEAVATVRFQARINAEGPVEVGVIGAGSWQLRVADRSLCYEPAVSGNGFAEELLAPPAQTSRLEVSRSDMVEAEVGVEPPASARMFGLIARMAPRDTDDVIADAVRAAAAADVAVVVVGLTEEQETESVDKTTLRLPGAQDVLLDAVAAAAKKTVVVVNAATPVIMPWLDRVDAVLWAGLPGQEGGHAVAAALLGDIEPAGRLVTTFPAEDGHAPAWSVTPVDGGLEYREGSFIGYRGHFARHAPDSRVLVRPRPGVLHLGVHRRAAPGGRGLAARRGDCHEYRRTRQSRGCAGVLQARRVEPAYEACRLAGGACGAWTVGIGGDPHRRPVVAPMGRCRWRLGQADRRGTLARPWTRRHPGNHRPRPVIDALIFGGHHTGALPRNDGHSSQRNDGHSSIRERL